jgi:Fe-S oxidoreductase
VLEREILASYGYKRTSVATRATLAYLDTRSPAANAAFHGGLVRLGGAIQRAACVIAAPLQPEDARRAPYALQVLRSPVPPAPAETLRDVLPHCEQDQVLVLEPEGAGAGAERSVFYFPGCGSERLQSHVSMAALHVLVSLGVRVVVPPPFLCCGFPAHANAKVEQHSRSVLRDTILFSQIREMFSHLSFDACVVTCGTCREGLEQMEAEKLFGGRLVDVALYAAERGLVLQAPSALAGPQRELLYHPPCHDSLDGEASAVLARIGGFGKVESVPHCCSEAGTLALSRPDITDAMLHRKRGAIAEALDGRPGAVMLTNCPSCVQGLGRNAPLGIEAKHLAVALAERLSGPDWRERFRAQAARAAAVHF